MMDYAEALRFLRGRIERDGHLVGVAAGSGITAKYAVAGGCDLVLALSSGKYRQMGCSSMAGFLCYANSNDLVMDYALRELMRPCAGVPLLFGLNAADPTRAMYDYIREIKRMGFTGVVNYPTAGMMDGRFRAALEAEGAGYEREVEAIRFAHYCGLLTVAYVFDPAQARAMASAGADVVCAHFGLTSGGVLGAKHVLSLERARRTADEIFEAAAEVSPGILRLVYGGPVTTPQDAQYMYRGSTCQGYIGGSAFERIPVESAVMEVTRSFKQSPSIEPRSQLERILFSDPRNYDSPRPPTSPSPTSPRSSGARSAAASASTSSPRAWKRPANSPPPASTASSRSRSSSATETTPNSARCTKNTTAFHRARIRKAQKNTSSRAEAPKKR